VLSSLFLLIANYEALEQPGSPKTTKVKMVGRVKARSKVVKTLHAKTSSCPFFISKGKRKKKFQSSKNGPSTIEGESAKSSFFTN